MLACPECARPFDTGRCECRRDWTETGGVPDLYVASSPNDAASAVRAWFEEHPQDPWRPEEDAASLAASGRRDPLLAELDELPARARVVDLGCGCGRAACFLALAGREVLGLDLAMTGLLRAEVFRRRAELATVSFARANLLRPPVQPGVVDVVLLVDVLEHVADAAAAVAAAARCLAPEGRLVLRVATPWAPDPGPEGRPPLWGGHLPEAVLGWLGDAGLTLRRSAPGIGAFSRAGPVLQPGPVPGALARWLQQARWGLGGGPPSIVYVAGR